jgi:hypothetical protein
MQLYYDSKPVTPPLLSIVLIDWSCRESFHILDYLERQNKPRNLYEVIWVEYYDRKAPPIFDKLIGCERSGAPPIVDQWVSLEMSSDFYFHKHLMYNAGICLSRGSIVVVCDSDAIVRDTFVQTIIEAFEKDPNVVLHLDEARNNDRRFYPFDYPSIEEVIGEGCINWKDGKTTGMWDTEDILHSRNYGACMAALKRDLISIGGADEHTDYLGHICGPYEMTFRLVNFGRRELWHSTEFLYHVWHPGQAGGHDYLAPHDGAHISLTALGARRSGRVLPLVENSAIQRLRLAGDDILHRSLLAQLISKDTLRNWSIEEVNKKQASLWRAWLSPVRIAGQPRLSKALLKMLAKQFWTKLTKVPRQLKSPRNIARKVINAYFFLRNSCQHNLYIARQSRQTLQYLLAQGTNEVSLYGTGDIAELISGLTHEIPLRIRSVYDDFGGKAFLGFDVRSVNECARNSDKIIVAAMVGIDEKVNRLKALGVQPERIIVLQ